MEDFNSKKEQDILSKQIAMYLSQNLQIYHYLK